MGDVYESFQPLPLNPKSLTLKISTARSAGNVWKHSAFYATYSREQKKSHIKPPPLKPKTRTRWSAHLPLDSGWVGIGEVRNIYKRLIRAPQPTRYCFQLWNIYKRLIRTPQPMCYYAYLNVSECIASRYLSDLNTDRSARKSNCSRAEPLRNSRAVQHLRNWWCFILNWLQTCIL
jgi:hypothetical protein